MSLAEELKAAKARMEAQKKADASKPKRKTTRRAATDWQVEDEIVALYLYLSDSSKFIKENYSKKRKISVRAMSTRMGVFESIHRKKAKNVSEQTQAVYDKYATLPIKDLLGVVISIHRCEFVRES